jgi:hypothetical protein
MLGPTVAPNGTRPKGFHNNRRAETGVGQKVTTIIVAPSGVRPELNRVEPIARLGGVQPGLKSVQPVVGPSGVRPELNQVEPVVGPNGAPPGLSVVQPFIGRNEPAAFETGGSVRPQGERRLAPKAAPPLRTLERSADSGAQAGRFPTIAAFGLSVRCSAALQGGTGSVQAGFCRAGGHDGRFARGRGGG